MCIRDSCSGQGFAGYPIYYLFAYFIIGDDSSSGSRRFSLRSVCGGINELRRRFRPEKSAISRVYGCYVNSSKELVSDLDESLGMICLLYTST